MQNIKFIWWHLYMSSYHKPCLVEQDCCKFCWGEATHFLFWSYCFGQHLTICDYICCSLWTKSVVHIYIYMDIYIRLVFSWPLAYYQDDDASDPCCRGRLPTAPSCTLGFPPSLVSQILWHFARPCGVALALWVILGTIVAFWASVLITWSTVKVFCTLWGDLGASFRHPWTSFGYPGSLCWCLVGTLGCGTGSLEPLFRKRL